MPYQRIAIAGLPKSGKTALINRLKELMPEWRVKSVGGILRDKYEELISSEKLNKCISFEEYFRNYVDDDTIISLNNSARDFLKGEKTILDSRFAVLNSRGIDALLIFLKAPISIIVDRCLKGGHYPDMSKEKILNELIKRQLDEVQVGNRLYGKCFGGFFDYREESHYNSKNALIIDSSKLSIEDEIDIIREYL